MNSAISEGLLIMVLGMGTVFIFLIIMVIVMMIVAKVVAVVDKYHPEKVADLPQVSVSSNANEQLLAVAIAAATLKKK